MKFMHLSDLHLGKSIHNFSLIEDQKYILDQITSAADHEHPDCVLISGDVYDRTIAPTEALRLFDDFLVALSKRAIQVFIVSGNHDSAERLSFGSRLIAESGIHIARDYAGTVDCCTVTDKYGDIDIYLLPFVKPLYVKRYFPDQEIETWTDALDIVIKNIPINSTNRNIILSHQFVTGAFRSESEEINVGGADNIDARVYEPFDYAALGHLHGAQSVGKETIRYCGTPLKYSFSETDQNKSITMVEFFEKGNITIREIPLIPKRDMKRLRGQYLQLTAREYYQDLNRNDFFQITLTDEEDQPDALGKLRIIYPNLLKLDYDNLRTRSASDLSDSIDVSRFTPNELFETLYKEQNHQDLSDVQKTYLDEIIEKIWEERS